MDLKIISETSFLNSDSQASFYSFFSSSLITIIIGFLAAGRNGFMFDTRTIRGFHRVPYYVNVFFFCLYSIFLSIPQWIVNADTGNCSENLQFYNDTNIVKIHFSCNNNVKALNALYFVIILIDPIYIFFFFNIIDFRSATSLFDSIKIRKRQIVNVVISLVILIIKIGIVIPRLVLIFMSTSVSAIVISVFNLLLIILNLFVHIRTLMLYRDWMIQYSSMRIVDISKNQSKRLINTDSDDDHDIQTQRSDVTDDDHDQTQSSDDDHDIAKIPIMKKSNRPKQRIEF